MRLIDADALMRKAVEKFYITNYFLHISTMIDTAPTIDAVPVVRCKDCVSFRYVDNGITYCAPMGIEMQPTDFCSYGERKDND